MVCILLMVRKFYAKQMIINMKQLITKILFMFGLMLLAASCGTELPEGFDNVEVNKVDDNSNPTPEDNGIPSENDNPLPTY